MDSSNNFYFSAAIAFASYLFFVFLFFMYLSSNDVKKFDSFSKNTVLKLDIVLQEIKTDDVKYVKKIKTNVKDNKISKKIVKKSASVSAKKKSDLKSLFAKVKTKSSVIKKKEVNNVEKSSTATRYKAKFEKQSKTDNKSLSKLLDSKKSTLAHVKVGNAKNEKDLYWSKIHAILESRYNQLLLIDGLFAKVRITIYLGGRFTYRVLQYSGDNSFDNQLDLFLEQQKNELFPSPKESKKTIELSFVGKERK